MNSELLQPGSELAGYRIERHVADGGMGGVYEAIQLSLHRRVALKLIARHLGTDERFRQRFRREARSAASIDHPNILPVYETGETPDGHPYIAMRFVDGQDLSSLLREQGPLDAQQTIAILRQVGDALDAAHQRGMIHRDVKPANVMLEATEDGWHAFLTDFGLAKPNEDETQYTASGEILGTVDYMAPEQVIGASLDSRADVYSFGCVVYRCLTGELPYKLETPAATLIAHANAPIPLPSDAMPGIPAPLDVVRAARDGEGSGEACALRRSADALGPDPTRGGGGGARPGGRRESDRGDPHDAAEAAGRPGRASLVPVEALVVHADPVVSRRGLYPDLGGRIPGWEESMNWISSIAGALLVAAAGLVVGVGMGGNNTARTVTSTTTVAHTVPMTVTAKAPPTKGAVDPPSAGATTSTTSTSGGSGGPSQEYYATYLASQNTGTDASNSDLDENPQNHTSPSRIHVIGSDILQVLPSRQSTRQQILPGMRRLA
jgi:serine/threonine protein kinase